MYNNILASGRAGYMSATTSNWFLNGEFVGISYFIKSKTFPKLSLYLIASSGYVQCTSPEISVTNITYSSVKANSIAFLGGAGFSYKFDDNVGFHLSINYLQTTPEFRGIQVNVSRGTNSGTYLAYNEQKISSLNIQAGVTIYLNRYIKK